MTNLQQLDAAITEMQAAKIAASRSARRREAAQEPDTKPGNYYVTCINGPRVARLVGPFKNHADALRLVDAARKIVVDADAYAWFWNFGTARYAEAMTKPGILNKHFAEAL